MTRTMPALDPRLAGLDLVVFDKDGTLIEFHAMWGGWTHDLVARLEAATGRPLRGELFRVIGFDEATGRADPHGGLAAMPMAVLRGLTRDVLMGLGLPEPAAEAALASAWHAPDPVTLAHPLADLGALFRAIRAGGTRVAVATSDDREPTERTLRALGVDGLVDALVCGDDGVPVKPDPRMFLHLCTVLEARPAHAAMVGDAVPDLRMGRAAGAGLTVGVLSGTATRDELEPLADLLVDSVAAFLGTAPGPGR